MIGSGDKRWLAAWHNVCQAVAAVCLFEVAFPCVSARADVEGPAQWEPCGWGGGGFYYATAFHPGKEGVIYLAGDVGGVYKTEDHGKNWKVINKGLADYGVFSLAVDRNRPDTVYAATENGLCKSADAGETWQVLPQTGRRELRITGEKNRSIRSIAVDPANGDVIYVASPAGKVFKTVDGGQTWTSIYEVSLEKETDDVFRAQFGRVNGAPFGGFFASLIYPADAKPEQCRGIGFSFKGEGTLPEKCFLVVRTKDGVSYTTRNLQDIFKNTEMTDVVLRPDDFELDWTFKKNSPERVSSVPAKPDLATIVRVDVSCAGSPLPGGMVVGRFQRFFFAVAGPDGSETLVTARDFVQSKPLQTYGNAATGNPVPGSIYSVAVSAKDPSLVLAATNDRGLVISEDAGKMWKELKTPVRASSVAFDPKDEKVIYASFFTDGVWKSTDKGKTWASAWEGVDTKPTTKISIREVAISQFDSQEIFAVGQAGWNGGFYISHDGGKSWQQSTTVKIDRESNPTMHGGTDKTPLSTATNVTLSPHNPKELFISANWRNCWSGDGGETLEERNRGADITCVTDIRFYKDKTYVTAMDEGSFVSEDDGRNWTQLWPKKYSRDLSGHNWRIAIDEVDGAQRIIATGSPWDNFPARVIVSPDGGETYHVVTEGLPDYRIAANTMWGVGYPRALAVDPKDPKVIYLGIDGDPTSGKSGGGIFKSTDGGATWKQLTKQPGSRRMFFGLAIDPNDTKRIYWAANGTRGGLWRSEDGGESWNHVFSKDSWLFNAMTNARGDVYAAGANLWRSTDGGATWKQLTNFKERAVVGLEIDPTNPKVHWITTKVWNGNAVGGVYKSVDNGESWQEITGNLPYVAPMVLRFSPKTRELWAGGVGLYKIKQ